MVDVEDYFSCGTITEQSHFKFLLERKGNFDPGFAFDKLFSFVILFSSYCLYCDDRVAENSGKYWQGEILVKGGGDEMKLAKRFYCTRLRKKKSFFMFLARL